MLLLPKHSNEPPPPAALPATRASSRPDRPLIPPAAPRRSGKDREAQNGSAYIFVNKKGCPLFARHSSLDGSAYIFPTKRTAFSADCASPQNGSAYIFLKNKAPFAFRRGPRQTRIVPTGPEGRTAGRSSHARLAVARAEKNVGKEDKTKGSTRKESGRPGRRGVYRSSGKAITRSNVCAYMHIPNRPHQTCAIDTRTSRTCQETATIFERKKHPFRLQRQRRVLFDFCVSRLGFSSAHPRKGPQDSRSTRGVSRVC